MKNLRDKLRKLDKQIAQVQHLIKTAEFYGGVFIWESEYKKNKIRFQKLDERRKAVRLERKKYAKP
jgi:hypothetical protein